MGVNKEEKNKLILFESSHHSIKAEKVFVNNQLDYRMTAVPPEISSDCGSAIIAVAALEELKELLQKNNISVEAIYELKNKNSKKEYKKIYSRN